MPRATSERQTPAEITYKPAATRAEREGAFRLIHRAYLRGGLTEPNSFGMRVTPYHLLPTTEVFVALLRGEVISTVTLVGDGKRGLPMEAVYPQEIARRRKQGLRLAEVSCLADRRRSITRFLPVFLKLCGLMGQAARKRGIDQLMIVVHPKHARFYERYISFRPVGAVCAYPSVCDRPGIPLCLDFARFDREPTASYEKFFGQPYPPELLQPYPMTARDQAYFAARVDPSFEQIDRGASRTAAQQEDLVQRCAS